MPHHKLKLVAAAIRAARASGRFQLRLGIIKLRPRRCTHALLLAIVLAYWPMWANADQAGPMVSSAYSRPAAGALVLLLPPSAEVVELESGFALLLDALHSQLTAAGFKTALLEKANYETVWAQEVDAVGGIFDAKTGAPKNAQRAEAMMALAVRLARETSAALVVFPRLVTRQAELSGTKAYWDGRLELLQTSGTFGGSASSRGTITAVSVQLIAMSGNGSLAFSTFGGVTLPFIVNFVSEKPELRKNIFQLESDVIGGVRIALEPLLAK
jgi:hypothetical protein